MNRFFRVTALAVGLYPILIVGCSGPVEPANISPDVVGVIERVWEDGGSWRMLVNEQEGSADCADKAWLHFGDYTSVWFSEGQAADTSYLAVGQHIEVWVADSIWALSCPAQNWAKDVVLLEVTAPGP